MKKYLSFISNSKRAELGDAGRLTADLLKFAAIGIVAYSALLVAFPRMIMPDMDSYEWQFGPVARDFGNSGDIDLLVVGSSHVYRSFDPRLAKEEGLTLVDLASPLQTPLNSYYLISDALDGSLKGSSGGLLGSFSGEKSSRRIGAVVFETYEKTFHVDKGVESYMKSLGGRAVTLRMVEEQFALRDWYAFNYLWYKILTDPFSSLKVPPLDAHEEYVPGGFFPSDDVRKPRSQSTIKDLKKEFDAQQSACSSDPKLCQADPLQLEYLERIMLLCKEKGIPLILVSTPMPPDVTDLNPYLLPVSKGISGLAAKHGVPLLTDFSKARLDPISDYLDPTHLNSGGAEKFTEEFLRQYKSLSGI